MADGSATLSGRDYEFQEPTLGRDSTVKGERISAENLTAIGKSFDLKNQKMTQKLRKTFWSIRVYFIYCQQLEPRVQLYVPREESFPHQVNSYWLGCSRRKTNWRLLERRQKQKSVRFMDGFHKIYVIERNSSEKKYTFREEETDENPNEIASRSHMAGYLDRNWKSQASEAKTNSVVLILQGKDGILYCTTTLRTNSFRWKDLKKALHLIFL